MSCIKKLWLTFERKISNILRTCYNKENRYSCNVIVICVLFICNVNEKENPAIRILPSRTLWNNEHAALCLAKLKKKRKAHQYCKKAITLEPDVADLYVIEGRIYFEEDNSKKAFESCVTSRFINDVRICILLRVLKKQSE